MTRTTRPATGTGPRRPGARRRTPVVVVVAVLLAGCASSRTGTTNTTSTLAPVGVVDGPGTLPPTIAPDTTVPATAAPTTAAPVVTTVPVTTTVPGRGTGELSKPDTWPIAGAVVGDANASVVVHDEARGPQCVGIRLATGQVLDACGDPGTSWYAVLPGPERLYVVAGRVPDAHLLVSTGAGDLDAPPLPAGAAAPRPFGVAGLALPRGASVVSVDGGADQSACPYARLFAALRAGGAVGDGPVGVRIEQCESSAASAVLPGGSQNLQGAEALFDRGPDGQWENVSVGSDVCVDPADLDPATLTDAQRAQLARSASVCRTLGR